MGHSRAVRVVLVMVVMAAAHSAAADDDLLDEDDPKNHKGQVLINAQLGTGFRGFFPYDEEYCGKLDDDGTNSPQCIGRLPVRLGLQLGYAFTAGFEAFVELGLGMENDFGTRADPDNGPKWFYAAPGIRGYIGDIGPLQFFSSLQLGVDFTDYGELDSPDYVVRNLNGLQFDVHHTFGVYLYFGAEARGLHYIGLALEGGVGVQARFP